MTASVYGSAQITSGYWEEFGISTSIAGLEWKYEVEGTEYVCVAPVTTGRPEKKTSGTLSSDSQYLLCGAESASTFTITLTCEQCSDIVLTKEVKVASPGDIVSAGDTIHKVNGTDTSVLTYGDTDTYSVEVSGDEYKSWTWTFSSSNSDVLKIDEGTGAAEAVGAGTARITATYADEKKGISIRVYMDVRVSTKKIAFPTGANLTYNGEEQTGVAAGEGYAVSGGSATDAGSYTATVTPDANHVWSDAATTAEKTASKSVSWSIGQAKNAITVSTSADALTGKIAKAQSFTRTATATSGKINYKTGNSSVKVSAAGKVTVPENFCGTTKITVSSPATTNYQAASVKTYTVRVYPARMTVKKLTCVKTRSIKVTWTKMTGADAYQVRYRVKGTSKWKTKKIASTKAAWKIGGLKKGKTYQVQIRAYDKQTKTWGTWSKSKAVKVKK